MHNSKLERRPAAGFPGRAKFYAIVLGLLTVSAAAADSESKAKRTGQAVSKTGQKTHPLSPALKLARESRDSIVAVKDYQATFIKKERVGLQLFPARMHIKHRTEPFSVYLRFFGRHDGREVIYVEGKNDGKLLAHETGLIGLVGTVALIPTSTQAMAEGRHPITRIGMQNMVGGVIEQWEAETKFGEVDVTYYHKAKLGDRPCTVIQTTHPRPRKQFKFHMTRLYIDKQTNLPVRVEQYDFSQRPGERPPLVEQYTYSNIETNVGLKPIDFDVRNSKYNY